MTKLEQVKAMAQRHAIATGRDHAVLNLNPYSPLYVCREYDERMQGSKELVCVICAPEGNMN
jgi:hypothetical protein